MEDYLDSDIEKSKPAGEFLKSVLNNLGIRQNKFADYIGLKPSNLSKVISGERLINYELALIFEKLFGIDSMLWIKIQAKNKLVELKSKYNRKDKNYSLSDLITL